MCVCVSVCVCVCVCVCVRACVRVFRVRAHTYASAYALPSFSPPNTSHSYSLSLPAHHTAQGKSLAPGWSPFVQATHRTAWRRRTGAGRGRRRRSSTSCASSPTGRRYTCWRRPPPPRRQGTPAGTCLPGHSCPAPANARDSRR